MQTFSRSTPVLLLSSLFLIVFGVRVTLIAVYGSPLPFADEWDADARNLFLPYLHQSLSLSDLFAPHNEHRLVLSRLLQLGLFELAGGWNVKLEMAVNALLAAGFATALLYGLSRLVPAPRHLLLFLFTTLVFSMPIGVENLVMGMNAAFYFLVIFSSGALVLLVGRPALSLGWWAGLALAVLACISMASGAITSAVAAIAIGLQMLVGGRNRRLSEWIGLALLVALATVMILLTPHIPANDVFRAKSPLDFLAALSAIAALPLFTPLGIVLVHFPLVLLVWTLWRERPSARSGLWLALALAGWAAAQMMLVAFSRSEYPTSPRYVDLILFLFPLDFALLLHFADRYPRLRKAAGAWLFVIATAIIGATYFSTFRMLKEHEARLSVLESGVVRYFADKDVVALASLPNADLLYPDIQIIVPLLDDPDLQAALPEPLRPETADPASVWEKTALGGRFSAATGAVLAAAFFVAPVLSGLGLVLLMLFVFADQRRRTD